MFRPKARKQLRLYVRNHSSKIVAIVFALLALVLGKKLYDFSAAPREERECDFVYPYSTDETTIQIAYFDLDKTRIDILQKGGSINDASCLNKTDVYAIVKVTSAEDVRAALQFAREHGLKVTPSGERHSMGGQSFSRGGLILDMRGMNEVTVDAERLTMHVESGASWKQVQAVLDAEGLAVKAMQSINLFTVGGTLSVNAHGVAHDPGQVGPTVRSMRVMLASGEIRTITPASDPALVSAVIGGYGLSGVILDVEFDIVKNESYAWVTKYIDFKDFPEYYRSTIIGNDNVGLFYARLSIAPTTYLTETAIHQYETLDFEIAPEPLKPASKVWIKRLIFNLSKTGGFGRWIRWTAEKYLEPGVHTCITRNQALGTGHEEEVCVATRNQKMNQSMEYLKTRVRDTNILHEYFVPLENSVSFIEGLKRVMREHDVNLLNVTLRIVTKDTLSALPYAKGDRIAFVLYFNQKLTAEDSAKLERATVDLIDLAIDEGGTYYLPYQLYYSDAQLRGAYPEVDAFFGLKRHFDPTELFSNAFYERYGK